jgi:hypothetical protein
MRPIASFGLRGLVALAALVPQVAWAQSKPGTPLSEQIEQRLQQMRKPQQSGTNSQPGSAPQIGINPLMLTSSELDAFRARIADCWDVPKGVRDLTNMRVTVHVKFAKDGSLAEPPKVLNSSPDPMFAVAAKSATAALTKCAPFRFMPAAKYDGWKDIVIDFDPHEMFGGKAR